MGLIINRDTITIKQSNEIGLACIEEVLDLRKSGDTCVCTRVDKSYPGGKDMIETCKKEEK